MVHIFNNLPKEYNVILDGLENCLVVTVSDVLPINVICKKMNCWYKKIKSKKDEKTEKENALGSYNKQYKQRCHKCGKYGHKPGKHKCPEITKIKKLKEIRKQTGIRIKIKNLMEYVIIATEKGI